MSVISEHRINEDHDFDWSNAMILDSECSYYKRLLSEMIHIKKQKNGINKKTDTDGLPEIYNEILDLLVER